MQYFNLENDELVLNPSHIDVEAFERILNLDTLEEVEGKDRISRAYRYFRKTWFRKNLTGSFVSLELEVWVGVVPLKLHSTLPK